VPSPREVLQKFSAVVVTGGSSGIGKSFIELLAGLKPDLVFCNLSRRKPDINIGELNLRHFPCDLAQSDEIERTVPDVVAHLNRAAPSGRVLLINNSGFGSYGNFPEPGLDQQLEMVDVNIGAVIHLTGLLLPFLKDRGGSVITVASTAAFQPTPSMAVYGATKIFVLHWSLALNEELRGSGVTLLAACPGPTATQFFRRAGLKAGSVVDSLSMSCEDVVLATLRALAAGRSQVVTGWKNQLSAWGGSLAPKPLAARVAGMILARYRLKQAAG
jgi:short-subunit dehydrogenase